jgi:hypothetical protein
VSAGRPDDEDRLPLRWAVILLGAAVAVVGLLFTIVGR